MRSELVFLGLGIALLAAAAFASAQRAPSSLDGTYIYEGGRAELHAIGQAIDEATAALPERSRNRWRAQLHTIVQPQPRLVLSRIEDEFAIAGARGAQLRSRTDDRAVALRGGWQLRQRVASDTVEQRIEKGAIAQLYRYSKLDARTLSMDVRITTPELSQPVTYTLRYRRQ